mgnify:CR=1 FL=1
MLHRRWAAGTGAASSSSSSSLREPLRRVRPSPSMEAVTMQQEVSAMGMARAASEQALLALAGADQTPDQTPLGTVSGGKTVATSDASSHLQSASNAPPPRSRPLLGVESSPTTAPPASTAPVDSAFSTTATSGLTAAGPGLVSGLPTDGAAKGSHSTSPGPSWYKEAALAGWYVAMFKPTTYRPRATLVLTSPGPHATLMLTSPGPHVILAWQAPRSGPRHRLAVHCRWLAAGRARGTCALCRGSLRSRRARRPRRRPSLRQLRQLRHHHL